MKSDEDKALERSVKDLEKQDKQVRKRQKLQARKAELEEKLNTIPKGRILNALIKIGCWMGILEQTDD